MDALAGNQVEVCGGRGGDVSDQTACSAGNVSGGHPDQLAAGFEFGDGDGEVIARTATG